MPYFHHPATGTTSWDFREALLQRKAPGARTAAALRTGEGGSHAEAVQHAEGRLPPLHVCGSGGLAGPTATATNANPNANATSGGQQRGEAAANLLTPRKSTSVACVVT